MTLVDVGVAESPMRHAIRLAHDAGVYPFQRFRTFMIELITKPVELKSS